MDWGMLKVEGAGQVRHCSFHLAVVRSSCPSEGLAFRQWSHHTPGHTRRWSSRARRKKRCEVNNTRRCGDGLQERTTSQT